MNNRGFSIERRQFKGHENIGSWQTVGFIQGTGTTTSPHTYTYLDNPLSDGIYQYRLKQEDFNGSFTYSNSIEANLYIISNFKLEQNYPNPFNPTTTIGYEVPTAAFVTIKVYDMLGKEITTLVNTNIDAGVHEITFDASRLTSGVYLYRMTAGRYTIQKKMLLLK